MRLLALLLIMIVACGAQAATLRAVLIESADDPRLERSRVERAALGHPGGPARDAVRMALDDAKIELEAAGAAVQLEVQAAATIEAARSAAQQAEKSGAAALVADLPAPWLLAVADAVRLPVLNVGEAADALRESDCRKNLWHLLPSERMRADALAQTLLARPWRKVLLLAGPSPADAARAVAARDSIKRFGLELVASKAFKLSADPRERALANPQLLTAGLTYDVIWVVDSDGEFARSLPYRTALPRPVVGDGGLVALAWHAQFERYGAPQVSRRFARSTRRAMTAHDWAAWMAARALAAAAVAQPKGPATAWAQALASIEIDGSKGTVTSFRAWDGQLRQPLLLTDGQGVIGAAPVDGVLHPRNTLDTLGADAPEKLCKARA